MLFAGVAVGVAVCAIRADRVGPNNSGAGRCVEISNSS